MLNRYEVTTDNRKGKLKEVFTSRRELVIVKLQADCDQRAAVRVTPFLDNFGPEDFVLAVTREQGVVTEVKTLFGEAPAWATVDTVEAGLTNSSADRVAWPGMTF